jgi:hypothetical protein
LPSHLRRGRSACRQGARHGQLQQLSSVQLPRGRSLSSPSLPGLGASSRTKWTRSFDRAVRAQPLRLVLPAEHPIVGRMPWTRKREQSPDGRLNRPAHRVRLCPEVTR